MSRRLLLALLCLVGCARMMADPVTVSQAKEKASQFINKRTAMRVRGSAQAVKPLKMSAVGRDDSYYIFNIGDDDGFVVVSGEDATEEILGYSDTGSINPDSMPCGMRMLLDNYAEQIKYLRENRITREQNKAPESAPKNSYMINRTLARFDQDAPFNGQCPISFITERCATGCVATAMAELMYYYRWPQQIVNTIPAYQTESNNYQIEEIPSGTAIDWVNILPEYDENKYNISSEQRNAVANLMKCCGASVRMDYGLLNGSGASSPSVPYALQQYFGYDNCAFEFAYSYNPGDWLNRLRHEIEENGPVFYRGVSTDGGSHAFLLEGYDGDYFYVNFGWGGSSNDYFKLNIVEDKFTYVNFQGAILNVTPKNNISSVNVPLRLWTDYLLTNHIDVYQRSQTTGYFENLKIKSSLVNWMPLSSSTFDIGLAFKNKYGNAFNTTGDTDASALEIKYKGGAEYDITDNLSYNYELTNGRYYIYFASRKTGTDEWVLNDNSQHKYAEAWVCGDWLSIKTTAQDGMNFSIVSCEQTDSTQLRVGLQANYELKVKDASSSSDSYDGALLAEIIWTGKEGVQKDSVVCINKVQCSVNGEVIVPISFVPFVEGEQQMHFLNKRWESVGSITVNAISATTSLDLLEVTQLTLKDGDVSRGLIDGTTLRGTLYMKNHDAVTKKADVTIGLEDVENTQSIRTKRAFVTIAPKSTVGYDFSFGSLTAGHYYVVTVSYASGEEFYRSEQMLCTTEGLGEVEPGNETLVAYEYWFDEDFDGIQSVSMNSNDAFIRASFNTQNLSNGVHKFNFRVKRSDGKYSAITSSLFLKRTAAQSSQMEYWFDDNFDQRDIVSISNTEEEQTLRLNLQNNTKYPMGFHKLNMRVMLTGGSESAVYSSGVLKLAAGRATQLECWIDNDRSNIISLEGQETDDGFIFVNDLDLGAVSPGHHRLYCRAVSNSGKTVSAITSVPIIVKSRYNQEAAAAAKVTGYSIAVDNEDPMVLSLSNPSDDVTIHYNLDVHDLTTGTHTLKAKFWNSMGAGVSETSQFTVAAPETPAIAFSATEKDGIVLLTYHIPANQLRYRVVRRDSNGSIATIYRRDVFRGNEEDGWYSDAPPAGSYTYYVVSYYDSNQTMSSSEVNINVAQAQDELNNCGYVTGIIYPQHGASPILTVKYSDGVETVTDNKCFERRLIPSGTQLTITVSGHSNDAFEEKTITVKPGENFVSIKALPSYEEDTRPNTNDYDLYFSSDLEWVGDTYQFMVRNATRKSWVGKVRLKIISKDRYDALKEDNGEFDIPDPTTQVGAGSVAPLTLRAEDNYIYAESEPLSLGHDMSGLVTISLNNIFPPDKKDWYYIFVESSGQWESDPPGNNKTKLVGIDYDYNVTKNPILRQVDKSALAKAQDKVLMQDAEHAANVILAICSKLNQFNGYIGDIEEFGRGLQERSKKVEVIDPDRLDNYIEHALETEDVAEFLNDGIVQAYINSIVASGISSLVQKFRDDIANEIFNGSKVVSEYLGDAMKYLKYIRKYREWEKEDDYDKFFDFAEGFLDYIDKYPTSPFASVMKTYVKVARSFVNKAREYGDVYYSYYAASYLLENIPKDSDKDTYKYNRHIDFKIKVRTNRLVFFNFDMYGTAPIRDVVVKVHNRPSDPDAVATIYFDLVPVWDGVMLKQRYFDNGSSASGQGHLDEGYPIDRMWMEIKWKNGRTTKIPLRNDIDGVEFESASILQNTKQWTVYLQSGTTKFNNMADILEVKK